MSHRPYPEPLRIARILVVGALLTGLGACSGTSVPEPGTEKYTEAVSAFYTGLAALQSGEGLGAEDQLEKVTDLAPGEPAAWANLAVLSMRRSAFDEAAERLARAKKLAPDNAEIALLEGRMAAQQGNSEEAITHLRRASELDPTNARARYALLEESERGGDATVDAEKLLKEILATEPGNLAALVELARIQARKNDAAGVAETVAQIEEGSADWPSEIRDQLGRMDDTGAATTQVAFLRNMLMRLPQFRHDQAAIKMPAEQGAELIEHFIRMQPPQARPSPADTTTTFTAGALPGGTRGSWSLAVPMLLDVQKKPIVLLTDGKTVTAPDINLPFPGNASAPGPNAIISGDFNYDYLNDLAFAGPAGIRLYQQEKDGRFNDITAKAGVPTAPATGLWIADVDMEGDLDLVVGNTGATWVLRNNGDGTFTRIPLFQEAVGLRSFAWADFDFDGDPDGAAVDSRGNLRLYLNGRGGHFESVVAPASDLLALTVADLDGDARLDILALGSDGSVQRVYTDVNRSRWIAAPVAPAGTLKPEAPATLQVADLDNNGALDLLASASSGTQLWLAHPDGALKPHAKLAGNRVSGAVDLTGDGKLDLLGIDSDNKPVLLTNKGSLSYNWTEFRPRAATVVGDQRINAFGIGGEIEVRAGLLFQKQAILTPLVHFGLGEMTRGDVARIVWPNGNVQAEFEVNAGRPVAATQRLKGSCPWLFSWDGQKMQFVTDVIWRSPLGLRINAQTTAGSETTLDWVKVRGDQLVPRPDGTYDLRVTAELWETHFFDHVSLLVVDHPEDTDIFIDERFAIPPPEMKVHVTSNPVSVRQARDQSGKDVTRTIQELDSDYVGGFDLTPYHGIAKEHWVEVDLSDAPLHGPLLLVGQGWLRPTDSSINVAVGQGTTAPPEGISIDVADGKGGWTNVRRGVGSPAGKSKSVLLDITGLIKPGMPARLRLRTTMEIYWDRLAWATPKSQDLARQQHLQPSVADLRFRGYSAAYEKDRSHPELPDYQMVRATNQFWRDLEGFYTRFGDIRELLYGVDDRYAILNAGDEMAFRFKAPAPPEKGYRRDFVFISDGWEKDGDYNTTFGQYVLPLPSHAIIDYTTPVLRLEDDPVYRQHREDWVRFHTRFVGTEQFQTALVPTPAK